MGPKILIKGLDVVIKRDLSKHRVLLDRSRAERDAYREALSILKKRKKHYWGLIGTGRYDDAALQHSVDELAVDMRAMSDKIRLSDEAIRHHTIIVDTLSDQLRDYHTKLEEAAHAAAG